MSNPANSFFGYQQPQKKVEPLKPSQSVSRKKIRHRLAQHRNAFGEASKILQENLAQSWGEIDSNMTGKLPPELHDTMHRAYAAAITQAEAWMELARALEEEFGITDRY
jgi:hypothetical protein